MKHELKIDKWEKRSDNIHKTREDSSECEELGYKLPVAETSLLEK